MEITDVFVDWAGKCGLVFEDGSTAWIQSIKGITYQNVFKKIVLYKRQKIALVYNERQTYVVDVNYIRTTSSWERGTVMQEGKPKIHTISRCPEVTTLVTGNGNCYVVADNVDHVLVEYTDLYWVNLTTGKRLSPKLEPNYTHRLRFSESKFGPVLQLMRFDHCEMNVLGLLEAVAPNGKVLYAELLEGEKLQYDSDCIVTTSSHRMFYITINCGSVLLQIITLRLLGHYLPPGHNVLNTFYGVYNSQDGLFKLPNAEVTKQWPYITSVKMLGEKTKPALHSSEYE